MSLDKFTEVRLITSNYLLINLSLSLISSLLIIYLAKSNSLFGSILLLLSIVNSELALIQSYSSIELGEILVFL